MQQYDSYKDSGVQWLGEIPNHWEVIKTSRVFTKIGSGTTPESGREDYYSEDGFHFLQTGDLNDAIINDTAKKITEKALRDKNLKIYPQGSLVVAMYGATIGKLGLLDIDTTVNQACCVLAETNKMFMKFAFYVFSSAKRDLIFQCKGGGQPNISQDTIRNEKIPVPPLSEQSAIATYLDEQTSKIDIAIAQQQKMIDLLNERKQIIINNAVTKGLNPNVKMKDSGVEWIGEMPEHWEMKRLKSILSVKDKRNANPEALLLSVYTAIGVRPRQELEERGNKASTVINYKIVSKGDLIVNRLLAWMGAYGLSNYDGVTSPDYDVYSFHADVNRGYYETLFRNTQFKSDCYKYGHGIMMMRWRTYSDEFLSINVPIPPKQEQDAIFDYLKPQIDKIEDSIEQCNKMLALLQERKQIIINDVVTGKVKV